MTDVQKEILSRCFQLQHENSRKDPSKMPWWIYEVWQEEMEFGPRYRCSTWFGPQSQARIKKHQRSLKKLEEMGLSISDEVHFIGGLHNTTTDEIEFFDVDLVPATHVDDLAELRETVASAGLRNREERSHTLNGGSEGKLASRSRDWSEVRPEWGLTGNAAFVIGPRGLTAESNLSGRSFMHSYNEKYDPDGKILEQIMTAPMIVTNWINMQYFASTVDQKHFGCGNKTIHNVVGKFGLLEGNGGDLRAGLAWQSLHDGTKYMHDPVRLLVVIAAKRVSIDQVIATHGNVRDLVANGWIQLVALEDGEFFRCSPTLFWKRIGSPTQAEDLPATASSRNPQLS